jgi:hypothetical protein
MPYLVNLPLVASDGKPLVHKHYRQEQDSAGLLIALPGNHYGVDGPLLYYPCRLIRDEGWDTLALTYSFQSAGLEFSHDMFPVVLQECQNAVRSILSEREYSRIGLVGKSLGAFVIAQLSDTEEGLQSARCLYITPPLGTPFFDHLFQQSSHAAHISIGTKDRFYTPEAVKALQAKRSFGLTLIEGADHSMDVAGDLAASMDAVRRVTLKGVDFLLEK